jgi:adenylyltransferase/sulfurtransferase
MPNQPDNHYDRYHRQMLAREFGPAGQEALGKACAAIAGCGALGSAQASHLVRAGIGSIILIDDDIVTENNLHRQFLFDEANAQQGSAKVAAAAEKLSAANSHVTIRPIQARLNADNIARITEGAGLIIDATDNYETRRIINAFAVDHRLPWIFGGVAGNTGMTATIIPGETACLACLGVNESSNPAETGVLAPIVHTVAAIQAMEAIKIMCGKTETLRRGLLFVDLWHGIFRQAECARRPDCPVCKHLNYSVSAR